MNLNNILNNQSKLRSIFLSLLKVFSNYITQNISNLLPKSLFYYTWSPLPGSLLTVRSIIIKELKILTLEVLRDDLRKVWVKFQIETSRLRTTPCVYHFITCISPCIIVYILYIMYIYINSWKFMWYTLIYTAIYTCRNGFCGNMCVI